jgi:predicted phosphodiesterase
MMRRILFPFLYLLFILFVLPSQPIYAQAENIHLSFKNEAMAITWTSPDPQSQVLKYGLDLRHLNQEVAVQSAPIDGLPGSFVFKALLKNLSPGATYFYKCGSGQTFTFKNRPKKRTKEVYKIGVWGDTQDNDGNRNFEKTTGIVSQMIKYPLDFTIHMGDIVENGSVAASWQGFLKIAQPLNAKLPFMPVTGNHDVENAHDKFNFQKPFPIYYSLFNLPGDNLNYSYDYGDIHFVALNSGFPKGAARLDKVLFSKGSAEYAWLENDLSNAKADKKIKWMILYVHYPLYAFGASLIPEWQHQLSPLIDQFEVDLVLSGHRHVYERHKAIRNRKIVEPKNPHVYQKSEGTVYITNGSAGGSLQGVGGAELATMAFTPSKKIHTYAIMTINGRMLNYEVFDDKGEKVDYFKIIK